MIISNAISYKGHSYNYTVPEYETCSKDETICRKITKDVK